MVAVAALDVPAAEAPPSSRPGKWITVIHLPPLAGASSSVAGAAASEAIKAAVNEMGLGWFESVMTRWILRSLRKWAYSQEDFRRMVGETPFRTCEINCDGIGLEVSLRK